LARAKSPRDETRVARIYTPTNSDQWKTHQCAGMPPLVGQAGFLAESY
jgi:hypothetical protein